ncbi:hypothetical protein G6F56_002749 [Rhizopus delemar]|nr:hypothetical protein G6F56_002749 [Rhizopus delemar]
MAYADDVICLLKDPSDLSRLLERFDIYSRASNSLLNCSKTQIISLSGSSSIYADTWCLHLQARDIRPWHDHTSPNSIIYLGFPLYSSVTQRDSFLNQLLIKTSTACNIHAQRSLSVRGRATVVNTLILSTLWHVLRVTSTPSSFLNQIQSCVSKFLTFGIFPRLSFETMCLPRKSGGLGVPNPYVQQRALKIRWLIPLLQPTHHPSSPLHALRRSIVLPRLAHFVLLHSCPPSFNPIDWDFRLPFLFPDLRSSLLCQSQLSLSQLFSAIDSLPQNWSHMVINPVTALSLPVMALTLNSVSTLPYSVTKGPNPPA